MKIVKKISLTGKDGKGRFALVDDDIFEYLNKNRWYAHKERNTFYAARTVFISWDGKTKILKNRVDTMHRVILRAKKGQIVDHADSNGLNNQRTNLRICTNAQNKRNQRKYKGCTSQYKGVHWSKATNKWRVIINIDKKRIELGLFINEVEAAKAYDIAALRYHKEFARLNFPLFA